MTWRAIALRLLLCLALALDGVGAAWASVHLSGGMDHHAATAMQAEPGDGMPCHGNSHAMPAPASSQPAADGSHPLPSKNQHAAPDCCQPHACQCACAHAASPPLVGLAMTASVPNRADALPPRISRRTEPAPLHLLRPPIG